MENFLLAMLHPKEWVLPARISSGLNDLITFGSSMFAMHQAPQVFGGGTQQSIRMGDINVGGIQITQPGASLSDIHRTVTKAIREAQQEQIVFDLAAVSPNW